MPLAAALKKALELKHLYSNKQYVMLMALFVRLNKEKLNSRVRVPPDETRLLLKEYKGALDDLGDALNYEMFSVPPDVLEVFFNGDPRAFVRQSYRHMSFYMSVDDAGEITTVHGTIVGLGDSHEKMTTLVVDICKVEKGTKRQDGHFLMVYVSTDTNRIGALV